MEHNRILSSILDIGIVPVVRTTTADSAIQSIEAIYRGGICAA
ncbi:MAG: 2-dehydro-3-deoxyphosphogluconate aldolase, partial [Acidobacteria bacterium]|nr:2-dehydro-3-deoxyphosphogluconate aldolase [Acidobacteriota bacterium]